MANNNVKKTIDRRNAGTHDTPTTADTRDIFEKALDVAPEVGMLAGGALGGLTGARKAMRGGYGGSRAGAADGIALRTIVGAYGGGMAGSIARYAGGRDPRDPASKVYRGKK